MEYRKYNGTIYLRLDPGDEIMSSLKELCTAEGIRAGHISGIGGCRKAKVGVFDTGTKRYIEQEVEAMLELVSLNGNITLSDGEPFMHLHAVFAYHNDRGESRVLAGHLLEATVGLTGEIIVTPAELNITRRYDESTGIKIWDFK